MIDMTKNLLLFTGSFRARITEDEKFHGASSQQNENGNKFYEKG